MQHFIRIQPFYLTAAFGLAVSALSLEQKETSSAARVSAADISGLPKWKIVFVLVKEWKVFLEQMSSKCH